MALRDSEVVTIQRPRWQRWIGGESFGASAFSQPTAAQALRPVGERRSVFSWIPTRCQNLIFPGQWALIGFVSAIDTSLTVKFRESLVFLESNPIANFLLELDSGDASLLIGFKFLGSTFALGILAALYFSNQRIGLMVSTGLACFQVGLLCYLFAA